MLGTEQAFAYYLAWATIFQGWALTAQHRGEEGLDQMRQGLDALQATGGAVRLPYYWALIAEVYGHVGQVAERRTLVANAFAHIAATGESWYEAELHRLTGELLLVQSRDQHAAAHACFHRPSRGPPSADQIPGVTRRHESGTAEAAAGQADRGAPVLAEVYGWFTEGFDTADLREARVLLAVDMNRQCTEGFATPYAPPLPLAILFQRRAHRVLSEHRRVYLLRTQPA